MSDFQLETSNWLDLKVATKNSRCVPKALKNARILNVNVATFRAKSKDGGKVLRDKLERIGMELPSGLFSPKMVAMKIGLNQMH